MADWGAGVKVHPYADSFPRIGDVEFEELVEDIRRNGLLHPLVKDLDGVLLDGRNRLRACEVLGVKPRWITYAGDDPEGLIASHNVHRRHLTTGQKALLALDRLPHHEAEAKERSQAANARGGQVSGGSAGHLQKERRRKQDGNARGGQVPGGSAGNLKKKRDGKPAKRQKPSVDARDEAGKEFDVPGRRVSDAKRLMEERSDLAEKVKDGSMTLNAAMKQLPPKPQKRGAKKRVDQFEAQMTTLAVSLELAADIVVPDEADPERLADFARRLRKARPNIGHLLKRLTEQETMQ